MFIIKLIKKYYIKQKTKDKILHILFNDKFCEPYIHFINNYFSPKQHIFLIGKWFDFPIPSSNNIIIIDKNYLKIGSRYAKKIIFHSFFDIDSLLYLYNKNNKILNKIYWMIWGGDLYEQKDDKNFYFIKKNCYAYISDVDGDCNVAIKNTILMLKKFMKLDIHFQLH